MPIDRHRVLMGLEQNQRSAFAAGHVAVESGHDVVALGFDGLTPMRQIRAD